MTLRTRLLLVALATFVVFVGGAAVALANQERDLVRQVDALLTSTPRQRFGSPPLQPQRPIDPSIIDRDADSIIDRDADSIIDRDADSIIDRDVDDDGPPISDLYVAVIDTDGTVVTLVEGQRLADVPSLDDLLTDQPESPTFRNVDGVAGTSQFRLLYTPAESGRVASVIALPTDDVRRTINQLRTTFAAMAAGLAVVLALAGWWVNRHGLRPISKMTETADAITSGDRTRRAEGSTDSTEVAKLASALNLMLDERDAGEDRIRAFVSDASHELRTPLTSISGYLDLYDEGGFRQPGQLDDAVRRMQLEASRMNLLVNDLLLLSKLDEKQPLSTKTIDVSLLLGDIAASALARQPERIIEVTSPAGRGATMEADRLRLHQAITVLVDNALAHTPIDAPVELTVEVDGDVAEIRVIDHGPGLSPHDVERVFDRFYRGDTSRARSLGGSGLGLSIAKSIIEAHDGTLDVTSQPGRGATFRARIPTRS